VQGFFSFSKHLFYTFYTGAVLTKYSIPLFGTSKDLKILEGTSASNGGRYFLLPIAFYLGKVVL